MGEGVGVVGGEAVAACVENVVRRFAAAALFAAFLFSRAAVVHPVQPYLVPL